MRAFWILAGPLFGAAPQAADLESRYVREARPLLEARCSGCHSPKKKKGGVDFASLAQPKAALGNARLWTRALAQVETGEMPPEGETPLSAAEKTALVAWLKGAAAYVDPDRSTWDPGPSLVRRLSRTEYMLSVRDLLGVDVDEALLPRESTGDAFETLGAALTLSTSLMEKYFTAADVALDRLFAKPSRLLDGEPRAVLERLARRAYRRPVEPEEVDRLARLGLRPGLKALLVSPYFLLRIEADRPDGRLSDAERAARLSYFLWSRPPSEAAMDVRAMLADPRARALTEHFWAKWMQLEKLAQARPSTEFFPAFNNKLKQAMRDEAMAFLDGLRREDRVLLELLDADYAYLNEDLAAHYGIDGVKGREIRKVSLSPERHRGGLLGMGAVLASTSHVHRTSPTLRGKYVLEVIFGTPPPPPPPDAGLIKEDPRKAKDVATFREMLAQHATQPSCALCHKRIDPLGFGLDNFDAVGAWRESKALDVSGTLPGGERFSGFAELKKVILGRQAAFIRNLCERLLSYALGREILPGDEGALREIQAAVEKGGYRYSALVEAVAASFPFQHRRAVK
jgi:mono/diheme cytochrome c family protein